MRFTGSSGGGRAIVAISLLVAALAYVDAQGSEVSSAAAPEGRGQTPERSSRTSEVEAAIASADLVERLETSTGSGFGGIWFEPSTAQVQVGVTSRASRRRAEAIAAQAGLATAVTEVRVRSTWAQLEAAQERWSYRLDDLFHQAAVSTWLSPQRNSLEVELGSTVSSSRRAALKRAAAAERVAVRILQSSQRRIALVPQARCKAFKADEAVCDQPIVAGVTIKSPKGAGTAEEWEPSEEGELEEVPEFEEEEEEGKGRFNCTAGPTARLENPAKLEDATKTYLLTAGHCINEKKGGGGVGKTWAAYSKAGVPAGENDIGPAITYLDDGTDVGVIEVTTTHWATANDPIPVTPTIAPWDETEPEPFSVFDQVTPVVEGKTCMAGQSSKIKCGEIIKKDVELLATRSGIKIKNLYEVEVFGTKVGDSGGPWFNKAQYEKSPPQGYVEGIHAGLNLKTNKAVFQSLDTAFAELSKLKKIDLELLTRANEIRHPVIHADKYPSTISAKDASSSDTFAAFGTSVKCTENEFDGVVNEPDPEDETADFEVTPVYGGCTAGGSLPTKFTNNSCKYKFTVTSKVAAGHYKSELGIVCPGGSPGIQFHVYANEGNQTSGITMCKLTVPPQSGLKTVTLTNSGGKIVADTTTLEGIKVKIHRNLFLCPSSGTENETSSGTYQINEPLSFAGSSEGKEVGIEIEGG